MYLQVKIALTGISAKCKSYITFGKAQSFGSFLVGHFL